MNIGITGASGYVGSKVYEYVSQRGEEPYELGRRRSVSDPAHFERFVLGDGISPTKLDALDLDVVVHCAYDFGPTAWSEIHEVNIQGTIDLFDAAAAAGVDVVQVSSLSAYESCQSKYGRAKLLLEDEAFEREFAVVRPGLVYGAELASVLGGLHTLIEHSPVVPIPAGGPYHHYLCHYADLAELVYRCCAGSVSNRSDPIVAASERSMAFREILGTLAETEGTNARFVPVPVSLTYYGLRTAETVGLNLGLRSDSVVGLVHPNTDPDFAATRETGVEFREFGPEPLRTGL